MVRALPSELSSIEDYVPYLHTIAYMNQKRTKTYLDDEALRKAAGYATMERFEKHREEWHNCSGIMPAGYMEALGIDLRIISFTIELDRELYDRAIQFPVMVSRYGSFGIDGEVVYESFPGEIEWASAIRYLESFGNKKGLTYFIYRPGIRYTSVSPSDGVYNSDYRPDIRITGQGIEFSPHHTGYIMSLLES